MWVTLGALLLAAAPGVATTQSAKVGPVTLRVDLRDAARKLFHVRMSLPVRPGALTLYYPKWIPGEHSPSGPLENLAGLQLTTDGKPVAWRRDLTDMFALHVEVPAGARTLEAAFDFLSPTAGGAFGQSVSATRDLVSLEWNQVLLYPAGSPSREITFEPTVILPAGWRCATALETLADQAGEIRFGPVSLATLVDSPLLAGRYFREVALASKPDRPVYLDMVADRPEELELSADQVQKFRDLVTQAKLLFGAEHYDHYRFLLVLSDDTGHFGLEHHRSSDDRTGGEFLTDGDAFLLSAGLLPHEYVHSWNGKYRRPADLWTPDFNTVPMRDDLLWVYEGLTTYLGDVLTARSGLRSAAGYLDALAASAADMDHRSGRAWRPLQDTADEAQILYFAPHAWQSWRRRTDFYAEGELIWLDVDTKLRELTHDRRSLDDFARLFYGTEDGSWVTKTYTFDDVVAALGRVAPFDWASFLRTRLDAKREHAPLDGIVRGGYQLVYGDQPSAYTTAQEKRRKIEDLEYSLGLTVSTDPKSSGRIDDVLWNGPAFASGLAPGMNLVAVDGRAFGPEILKSAVTAARTSSRPIELLVRDQDFYRTYSIDDHDGPRYPRLERREATPAFLDEIIAPRQ